MDIKDKKFLEDMAEYFEKQSDIGEDKTHWANIYNAQNCRRIAAAITNPDGELLGCPFLTETDADDGVVHNPKAYKANNNFYVECGCGATGPLVTVGKDVPDAEGFKSAENCWNATRAPAMAVPDEGVEAFIDYIFQYTNPSKDMKIFAVTATALRDAAIRRDEREKCAALVRAMLLPYSKPDIDELSYNEAILDAYLAIRNMKDQL